MTKRGRPYRKGLIDERFFRIEDRGYSTPCWIWMRATVGERAHGQVRVKGKNTVAHRAVWEERIGPWPDDLQADHLCRVRLCVNPEHIEPVTGSVNQRRGMNAKLTAEDHLELQRLYTDGHSIRELARHFGVNRDTIKRHLKVGNRYHDPKTSS